MYKGKFVYEIEQKDIGKAFLKYTACSRCHKKEVIVVSNLLGRIISCDVGKRIYAERDNADSRIIYQIESQDQMEKRTKTGVHGEKR